MKRLLIILMAVFLLSACGKSVDIDGEKVNYEELQVKIEDKEKELNEVSQELDEGKEHYEELKKLDTQQDVLTESIVDYELELISVEKELEEKQEELDKVDEELIKVNDEPIKVNPGTFYFGDDIEEGRYKITYQDGYNGNVFFRGDNDFGETFGKGNHSIEEYTFYADDGDELEATIPILLYPVE